ncbi:MAG: hydrolase, family [Cutibacterium acnes]|nr:hydrolase, family [Cutibacterium acnes]
MLIATDLDGTFLTPDATVSPRNRAAVKAAEAAGIHVIPVTGRAIGGLRVIGPVFHRHALVSNGAVGTDMSTGETLFTETMSARRGTTRLSLPLSLRTIPPSTFSSVVRSCALVKPSSS